MNMNHDNDDDMMLDAAGAFVDSKGGGGGCGGGGGSARGLTHPSTLVSNAPPLPPLLTAKEQPRQLQRARLK
jgi:hypothetical protein